MTTQEAINFLANCPLAFRGFQDTAIVVFNILNRYGIRAGVSYSFDSLVVYAWSSRQDKYVDKHSKTETKEYLHMLVSEIQHDIDTAFKNEYYELVTAIFGEKL